MRIHLGTDLDSIQRLHEARAVSKEIVRRGGEGLASLPLQRQESLNVLVSGVVYPVFVVSAHDPDSTDPVYYIP